MSDESGGETFGAVMWKMIDSADLSIIVLRSSPQ
jgi:hypothetical protein